MKKVFFLLARIFVFVLVFALALQNTQLATLALFFGYSWEAPLILIISAFFVLGLLLGSLLLIPYLWQQRKILLAYKKCQPNDKESNK